MVVIKNMRLPDTCSECGGCDDWSENKNTRYFCSLADESPDLDTEKIWECRPDWCPLCEADDMFDELRRWLLENSIKAKDIGPMVASYWAGWGDAVSGVSRKIAAITGSDREPNRCANCGHSDETYGKTHCMGQKGAPEVDPNDYCFEHKRVEWRT